MKLTIVDWLVIAGYFLANLIIGLIYRKRAQRSVDDFFVSGRNVPWWLAGTSMVATTFAADTPLVVTGLTVKYGIAGNWLWWSMLLSGMMTVFFFARLWRRSGVITDVELVELRYAGRPAAVLRGFRAVYLGVLMNCLIMGWVNLAMVKILTVTLGISKLSAVLFCLAITGAYTTISGLWGVLVTDFFQFILKMSMVIALAYFAVHAVGGMAAMKAKLLALDALRTGSETAGSILSFLPDPHSAWMPLSVFLVYVGVNWWASWYPGAEPGGGGYVAQRMFCAKDERHSLLATLSFNVMHYALRPWPWILVGLVSAILYPSLADKETGYLVVLVDHLPASLRGLMLAAFAAAYMSTIGTHLNWGSSYVVNDFYRRFLVRGASERHYLRVSQAATLALMLLAAAVSYLLHSIEGAWKLLLMIGAGTGGVYLLRWYWWRINAWSEITAMITALLASVTVTWIVPPAGSDQIIFAKTVVVTAAVCTAAWLAVTFLTGPEPMEKLVEFYRRVRPNAALWAPVALRAPEVRADRDGWYNLVDWLLGCAMVYGALFGTGKILFGENLVGAALLLLAAISAALIYRDFARRGWANYAG